MKEEDFDFRDYNKYIVTFSGGKDSTALVLHLLDQGIPKHKIELWHHNIDGQGESFFDWPITPDYCRAFAQALGLPIYFSWKEGGFWREMMRENQRTAPILFEDGDYNLQTVGGTRGKINTRRMFPQVSGDIRTRWCSGYLKIDVGTAAIVNQDRFNGIRTIVLSGERAEESSRRAGYKKIQPDRADLRNGIKKQRHVDRWRPIRDWPEAQVWDIMEKYKIHAHPAYYLGWGRVSCMWCIFGNANQFRSAFDLDSEKAIRLSDLEIDFDTTIKRNTSLSNLIIKGTPYKALSDQRMASQALNNKYLMPILIDKWKQPAGAFGEGAGPS